MTLDEITHRALDNMEDLHMQILEHMDHLDEIIEKMETLTMREFHAWLLREKR